MASDAVNGNKLVTYERMPDGLLTELSRTATNGLGAAGVLDPLGSQNSVIMSPNKQYVLATNGGSNTISVFSVKKTGVAVLLKTYSSHPAQNSSKPASLTANAKLVYVLNSGNVASISGYTVDWNKKGKLTYITNSSRSIEGSFGQIGISSDGTLLILTGKADQFAVFQLNSKGIPSESSAIFSSSRKGRKPFSFVWDKTFKYIYVAEAFGGVASYEVSSNGEVKLVMEIATNSAATCWIVKSPTSKYFYAINAGAPSISGFSETKTAGVFARVNGSLYLSATTVDMDVALFGPGSAPLDSAVTQDNKFLYTILAGRGTIAMFEIMSDGTLLSRGEIPLSLPGYNGLNGIVVN